MHSKTVITFGGCFLAILAWFVFSLLIGEIYPGGMNIYLVRRAFLDNYGRSLAWWATALWMLLTLIVIELIVGAVRRVYFPNDYDVMQRLEKNGELDLLDEEKGDVLETEEADDEVRRSFVMRDLGSEVVPASRGTSFQDNGRPSLHVEKRGASFQQDTRRPSLQMEKRGSSFQDTRRPSLQMEKRGASFQDRRPPLQVDTRVSFNEQGYPERRRKRAFTTLEEEERQNAEEDRGEESPAEGEASAGAPAEERRNNPFEG